MPRPSDFESIPPSNDQPVRSACTLCEGTGYSVELRVIWKRPRLDGPPVKCSRRVASTEEAAEKIVELRALGMLDIDCLTGSEVCECRSGKQKAPKATASELELPATDAEQSAMRETAREKARKQRATGERE